MTRESKTELDNADILITWENEGRIWEVTGKCDIEIELYDPDERAARNAGWWEFAYKNPEEFSKLKANISGEFLERSDGSLYTIKDTSMGEINTAPDESEKDNYVKKLEVTHLITVTVPSTEYTMKDLEAAAKAAGAPASADINVIRSVGCVDIEFEWKEND